MPADPTEPSPPPALPPRGPAAGKRPRVSVVLTTYRRAALIGQTIRSVLDQRFADFELLVRDDGKPGDGTEEAVIAAAAGDPRVRYHRNETNLRMPGNLNAGIRDAQGDLIAVCHDHDLFAPDYLERLVALLDAHPTALYAHCAIEHVDHEGAPTPSQNEAYPAAAFTPGRAWLEALLAGFACPVCALALVRRDAHERYGLYHPTYDFISDVEMWMRLAEVGDVVFDARPLVRIRGREPGHFADVDPWPILANLFAIHRRYVRRAYHGLRRLEREVSIDARADKALLLEVAARLKRRKAIRFGASKSALRRVAGPVGRRLAAMWP